MLHELTNFISTIYVEEKKESLEPLSN